jgi:hypothetical protein
MAQPIIRGIQAVGAVDIKYEYNSGDHKLHLNTDVMRLSGEASQYNVIETAGGVPIAGFRLDGEFLRAVQQIASSIQVPILGGGAVALTNNNRSGTLNINCTKVSTPAAGATYDKDVVDEHGQIVHHKGDLIAEATGAMYHGGGLGPVNAEAYDLVFMAQVQQSQPGGDSVGSTITVDFMFCGLHTTIQFQGCTIASVDPLGLAGNDAPNYNVAINYLNWTVNASNSNGAAVVV